MRQPHKYLLILITFIFIAGIIYVYLNKVKITEVEQITNINNNSKGKNIGLRKCDYLVQQKSSLFTCEIQIIPNDTVKSITINNIVIPENYYFKNKANQNNGFYLDVSPYLKLGTNKIHIEIQGPSACCGLFIRDTTFYEKYILILGLICFLPFIFYGIWDSIFISNFNKLIKTNRKIIILIFSIFGFISIIFLNNYFFNPQIEYVKNDGTLGILSLPLKDKKELNGVLHFKGSIYNICSIKNRFNLSICNPLKENSKSHFTKISINGVDHSYLDTISRQKDFYYEILNIPLSNYLRFGRNEIEFYIYIDNKTTSITIDKLNGNGRIIVSFILLLFIFSPLIYYLYTKVLYGRIVTILFLIAVFIWLLCIYSFQWYEYSYDSSGHLEYVSYIFQNTHVPISSGGWVFYHPSLYYITSAIFWHLCNLINNFSPEELNTLLQAYALVLFICYCFTSILIINLIFNHYINAIYINVKNVFFKIIYVVMISILLFWPANIIHAGRIGNDNLLFLLFAISFYYLLKWDLSKNNKYLVLSLIFSALATWTKSNALLLFVITFGLFFYHFIFDKNRKVQIIKYFQHFILIIGVLGLCFFFIIKEKKQNNWAYQDSSFIVSNANKLPDGLRVENNLKDFFVFNPVAFINITYTDTWNDNMGRQYFLVFLAKTSLFGEFKFNNPTSVIFASLINITYLLILILVLLGFYYGLSHLSTNIIFMASLIVFFVSVLLMRIFAPYSCIADFRYIYPAVIPMTYFIGISLSSFFIKRKFLYYIGVSVVSIFIVSCILFQISSLLIFFR